MNNGNHPKKTAKIISLMKENNELNKMNECFQSRLNEAQLDNDILRNYYQFENILQNKKLQEIKKLLEEQIEETESFKKINTNLEQINTNLEQINEIRQQQVKNLEQMNAIYEQINAIYGYNFGVFIGMLCINPLIRMTRDWLNDENKGKSPDEYFTDISYSIISVSTSLGISFATKFLYKKALPNYLQENIFEISEMIPEFGSHVLTGMTHSTATEFLMLTGDILSSSYCELYGCHSENSTPEGALIKSM